VARQQIRPYSRIAWEEKRRRWILEQEQRRRARRRTFVALASLAVLFAAIWIYIVTPEDWTERAERYVRKVTAITSGASGR